MPTPSEMALYSLLNELEQNERKRSKAIQDLARATSELARQDAWRRVDEGANRRMCLCEELVEVWASVKDGVVAKAVGQ